MTNSMKLDKVRAAFDDISDNGNLKRYHLTLTEAYEAWDIIVSILENGSAETISNAVKNFFEQRYFHVKEKGIGWEIKF